MNRLKKVISLIALLVLVGTDFLNPISYALEQEEMNFEVETNDVIDEENTDEETANELENEVIEEMNEEVENVGDNNWDESGENEEDKEVEVNEEEKLSENEYGDEIDEEVENVDNNDLGSESEENGEDKDNTVEELENEVVDEVDEEVDGGEEGEITGEIVDEVDEELKEGDDKIDEEEKFDEGKSFEEILDNLGKDKLILQQSESLTKGSSGSVEKGDIVTYTVTFDANRGTFANLPTPNPQTVNSGELITNIPSADPELPGYTFQGWFTAADGGNQWNFSNDVVNNDVTLYAHWTYNYAFGELDAYIIDAGGTQFDFVMMDRNLGATVIYNKDYYNQNFGSFGYVYQWGNNYGFPRCNGNGACSWANTATTRVPKSTWEKYIPSKYASSTFVLKAAGNTWNDGASQNDNFWGNYTNNVIDKQGPCPDGYHVPSRNEFNGTNGLYAKWKEVYGFTTFKAEQQEIFTREFLFPLAGTHKKGDTAEVEQGICADYWLSSSSSAEGAYNIWFCKEGGNQYYDKNGYSQSNIGNRNNGSTIRCFKNSNTANLTIDVDGGNSAIITIHKKVDGERSIVALTDPKKTNRVFDGWYTTSDFSEGTLKQKGETLSAQENALYAKWKCNKGYAFNDNNECVVGKTVIFLNEGVEYDYKTALQGNTVEKPEPDPVSSTGGKIFLGWYEQGDPDETVLTFPYTVNDDINLVAKYQNDNRTYTITWKNGDDSIIDTTTVAHGTVPTHPDAAGYTDTVNHRVYTFEEWVPTPVAATADATYVATYANACQNGYHEVLGVCTINEYTITWSYKKTTGGNTSDTTTVEHGVVPTHADPLTYTSSHKVYTFLEWDPTLEVATANKKYTAKYSTMCESGYDEVDGKCINEQSVTCTQTGAPANAHYITGNVTITYNGTTWSTPTACAWDCDSQYHQEGNSCVSDSSTAQCDDSGTPANATATLVNVPISWDPSLNGGLGGRTAPTACAWTCNSHYHTGVNNNSCDIDTFQIKWIDGDGNTLKTERVAYGSTPEYSGATPTKTATAQYTYTFNNTWDPAVVAVITGATYTAQFDSIVNIYTITWSIDGEETTQQVEYGAVPSHEEPSKASTETQNFAFGGWTKNGNPVTLSEETVTEDVTYVAVFTPSTRYYTITWKNEDGSVIDTTTVEYGVVPTHADAVQDPDDQYTYTFKGWDPTLVAVTGEATYRATYNYNIRSYEVTILANDMSYGTVYGGPIVANYGTLISINSDILTIGEETLTAIPAESVAQYSYGFSGWILNNCETGGVYKVLPNCTITAEFIQTLRQYTVIFVDDNGTILKDATVYDYGTLVENIIKPVDPEKTATAQYTYTFAGWDPVLSDVTGDVTYTATYSGTLREYTITWLTEDGNLIDTTTVAYGILPTHGDASQPADAQYTYEFAGWMPEVVAVTGDATYRATYNYIKNTYTITWLNDDGSLIGTTTLEYGEMPFHVAPLKPADDEFTYYFSGWDPAIVTVVGNAEYKATYTAEKKGQNNWQNSGHNMSGGGRILNDDPDNQHGSAEEIQDGSEFTGDIESMLDDPNETLSLYEWARENGITTMDTLEEANPDGLVTRGHLAKMVVNYMVNVLGREMPYDVTYNCVYWGDDESVWESNEIRDYATKACAFGVMGINMENNEFLPNNIVTRVEFGTVMSRVLWGDRYNIIDTDNRSYYEAHLRALKKNGILKQINDPEDRWEIRKWVWLVFRRVKEKKK